MLETIKKPDSLIGEALEKEGNILPNISYAQMFSKQDKLQPLQKFKDLKFNIPKKAEVTFNYSPTIFREQVNASVEKLNQKPNNPIILNDLGMTYFVVGKLTKAIKYFKEAIIADPNFLAAAQNLAKAYLAYGKLEKAIEVYSELILKMSNKPDLVHQYGLLMITIGDLAKARLSLGQIDKKYDKYFEVANTVGLIELLQNNLQEAQKSFELSLKINKKYPDAYNNLGVVYLNRNKFSKARELFSKASEVSEKYKDGYVNTINSFLQEGNDKKALEYISGLEENLQVYPEIAFKEAWIYMQNGDFEKSLKLYLRMEQNNVGTPDVLNNIGHAYANLGDPTKAVQYFQRAVSLNNYHLLSIRNLAVTHAELGEYKIAKHYADILLRADPDSDAALYVLGAYHINREEWDEGETYLLKAKDLGTDIETVYALIGYLFTDVRSQVDEAIVILQARYDLGARQFDILNNLAHALLNANKVSEAKKYIDMIEVEHPVRLATLGLYELKRNNIAAAKKYYKLAEKIARSPLNSQIRQYSLFDISKYYINKNRLKLAKTTLEELIKIEKGSKYIRQQATDLLVELD